MSMTSITIVLLKKNLLINRAMLWRSLLLNHPPYSGMGAKKAKLKQQI